jgi:hypothetical protein
LNKAGEDAVARRIDTQLRHFGTKPNCCITSIRKSHRTLSKALAMSNLRKSLGCFALWREIGVVFFLL